MRSVDHVVSLYLSIAVSSVSFALNYKRTLRGLLKSMFSN